MYFIHSFCNGNNRLNYYLADSSRPQKPIRKPYPTAFSTPAALCGDSKPVTSLSHRFIIVYRKNHPVSSPFRKFVQNLYKYICYNGFIKANEEDLMKKCNVCGCIVDEKSECPICGNTLTYEPPCMEEKERLVFSKYYLIYLLKYTWFAILCTAIGLVIAITSKTSLSVALILAIVMLTVSFLFGMFNRSIVRFLQNIFTERWAVFFAFRAQFITGLLAISYFVISALL